MPHYVQTRGWIRDFQIFFGEVTYNLANYANNKIRLCLLINLNPVLGNTCLLHIPAKNPVLRSRFCCINQTRLLECSNPVMKLFLCFVKRTCRRDECDHRKSFAYERRQGIFLSVKASREYFCLRTHSRLNLPVFLPVLALSLLYRN